MDGQRDQDVSPGYPGPAGLGQEDLDTDRKQGAGDTIKQAAHDLVHGQARYIDEQEPELADAPGMDLHQRQDIGLAAADVENGPYDGGAGTPLPDVAQTSSMSGNGPITESSESR